jgi:anti-anti-sigma factor
MNLTIESQKDGICQMALAGRVSQTAVNSNSDQLSQLLGEANYNQSVLLSLGRTDYIDSSGIGWLLATDKKIRSAGGRLVLYGVPTEIQQVFRLLRLGSVLKIAADLPEAMSVAKGESHEG